MKPLGANSCKHCGLWQEVWSYQLCMNGKGHELNDSNQKNQVQLNDMAIGAGAATVIGKLLAEQKQQTSVDSVLQERGIRYGSFADNSRFATQLTRMIFAAQQERIQRGQLPMTEYEINALVMIAAKMSRIVTGDSAYADNWVDIAGYAELGRNPR